MYIDYGNFDFFLDPKGKNIENNIENLLNEENCYKKHFKEKNTRLSIEQLMFCILSGIFLIFCFYLKMNLLFLLIHGISTILLFLNTLLIYKELSKNKINFFNVYLYKNLFSSIIYFLLAADILWLSFKKIIEKENDSNLSVSNINNSPENGYRKYEYKYYIMIIFFIKFIYFSFFSILKKNIKLIISIMETIFLFIFNYCYSNEFILEIIVNLISNVFCFYIIIETLKIKKKYYFFKRSYKKTFFQFNRKFEGLGVKNLLIIGENVIDLKKDFDNSSIIISKGTYNQTLLDNHQVNSLKEKTNKRKSEKTLRISLTNYDFNNNNKKEFLKNLIEINQLFTIEDIKAESAFENAFNQNLDNLVLNKNLENDDDNEKFKSFYKNYFNEDYFKKQLLKINLFELIIKLRIEIELEMNIDNNLNDSIEKKLSILKMNKAKSLKKFKTTRNFVKNNFYEKSDGKNNNNNFRLTSRVYSLDESRFTNNDRRNFRKFETNTIKHINRNLPDKKTSILPIKKKFTEISLINMIECNDSKNKFQSININNSQNLLINDNNPISLDIKDKNSYMDSHRLQRYSIMNESDNNSNYGNNNYNNLQNQINDNYMRNSTKIFDSKTDSYLQIKFNYLLDKINKLKGQLNSAENYIFLGKFISKENINDYNLFGVPKNENFLYEGIYLNLNNRKTFNVYLKRTNVNKNIYLELLITEDVDFIRFNLHPIFNYKKEFNNFNTDKLIHQIANPNLNNIICEDNLNNCSNNSYTLIEERKENNTKNMQIRPSVRLQNNHSNPKTNLNNSNVNNENFNFKEFGKIAHELKTPLNAIIGLMNELIVINKQENLETNLVSINSLANYLTFLITDLTQYCNNFNIEEIQIFLEKIDLKDILSFSFDILKALLACKSSENNRIIAEFEFDDQISLLSVINSDEIRLKQIILNFISNSVKFTKNGSIRIKAKLKKEKQFIKISIIDTGIGIKDEDLEKLLYEKERINDGSILNRFGSGFGLAISKSLSEKLNLRMKMKSNYGIGSNFSLYIPYEENKNLTSETIVYNDLQNFSELNLYKVPSIKIFRSDDITPILEMQTTRKFSKKMEIKSDLKKAIVSYTGTSSCDLSNFNINSERISKCTDNLPFRYLNPSELNRTLKCGNHTGIERKNTFLEIFNSGKL